MGKAGGPRAQNYPQLYFKVEYSIDSETMSQKKEEKKLAGWLALPPIPMP